jgi:site-specific DNA-methyltransferase (adenine-specific)
MIAQGLELNKIYNMDCIEGMKMLPDNSIDLTLTSPPYDNLRTYKGFEWNFEETAKELFRVTKEGGIVVWVVGDKTDKGSETGTSFKQALFFKECGFNLHDTMIFEKNNPVPQADKTRYTQSFEFMFVFSKGKPKTVNRIMTECQHIGKVHFGKNKLNEENCDRKIDRAVKPTKPLKNIWSYNVGINQSSKDKIASKHPAIFPEQLAQDYILSWSNEGDIVLDCFMGSGTTAKMALLNNRKYIGFEISKEYCEIAEQRIAEVKGGEADA